MSAWREVIPKIKKYSNVFETDLKGFFDNVSVWKVLKELNDTKSVYSTWLYKLCESIPGFPKIKKLDESKFDSFQIKGNVPRGMQVDYNGIESPSIHLGGSKKGAEYLEEQNKGLLPGGFPQGMPMSPFLSMLALDNYLKQQVSTSYADDPIFYSNKKFNIVDEPENGIINSIEKSKWVKKDGIWNPEGLKYLGFRLLPNFEWKSETRNGVKAGINKILKTLYTNEGINLLKNVRSEQDLVNTSDLIVEQNKKVSNKEILENISKRKIFGFVMSCMQIGDWANDHALEDRRKALSRQAAALSKKSLLWEVRPGTLPNNLDSSKSIPFLVKALTTVMKTRKKVKVISRTNHSKKNAQ